MVTKTLFLLEGGNVREVIVDNGDQNAVLFKTRIILWGKILGFLLYVQITYTVMRAKIFSD